MLQNEPPPCLCLVRIFDVNIRVALAESPFGVPWVLGPGDLSVVH